LGQLVGLSTGAWKGACVTADSDSDSDIPCRLLQFVYNCLYFVYFQNAGWMLRCWSTVITCM